VYPYQPSVLLARVALAFFFVAVPFRVAIWGYYGFLVYHDGLYLFLGCHP
jgi:hypothetical protein